MSRVFGKALAILGILLPILLWIGIKFLLDVPDRYLPSPQSVIVAATSIEPSILLHFFASAARLISGFFVGIFIGIITASLLYQNRYVEKFLSPLLVSMQNVPPLAIVPFFILWFGFSETGKFLVVFLATFINLTMYGLRTLKEIDEHYLVMATSYKIKPSTLLFNLYIPYLLGKSLPTVRYMLSISVGLVLFSELLGAQLGLGYLIQNARSTFSMDLVFLSGLAATVLYVSIDFALTLLWQSVIPWSKK